VSIAHPLNQPAEDSYTSSLAVDIVSIRSEPPSTCLSCPGSAWARILRQSHTVLAVPGSAWDGAGF
jgi:hypothetical protein